MNGEPARRPGGVARLAALAATAAGFLAVFSVGFPPAARDRLPVLLLALALGLAAAWNPARGLVAFAFLFPLSGLGDRAFGGADAVAWPVLLFTGFAAGWTFRFLYDFENVPDPSRADRVLRGLSAVWSLAAILSIVRARTLWAALHGLGLRAVNIEGLLDASAIRDAVLSLSALASGAGFFFILRRSGAALRARALRAALAGCAVSGAAAVAERLGMPPGETNAFWRMTGRLSGGAIDPNALGILCGLALVAAAAALFGASNGRFGALVLAGACGAGLVLSGSRSGLLVVGTGLLALTLAPRLPARRRLVLAAVCAAGLAVVGGLLLRGDRGTLGERLAQLLDTSLSAEARASSRPVLWASAVDLFARDPIAGGGLGSFSWQLPTLLAERGRALPLRDNPGSAYLQALAETGAIGFLLTLGLAVVLAREGLAALARGRDEPLEAGCGAGVLGFLVALAVGSHWFAPDASLLFFLLAAVSARPAAAPAPARAAGRSWPWGRWSLRAAAAVYAAAVLVAAVSTLSAEEAFRYRRGMGFHGKEEGPGGSFYWTQRRFAIRVPAGETMRMTLAHYTPEGRDVELLAEADGTTVLRRDLRPGQSLPLRLAAAPGASADRPVHPLAGVRPPSPRALRGPARARPRRRLPGAVGPWSSSSTRLRGAARCGASSSGRAGRRSPSC